MNSEQFTYWLQGFTELNPSMEQPTPEQWKSITEHLKTVFVKVTPAVQQGTLTVSDVPMSSSPKTLEQYLRQYPYLAGPQTVTC